MSRPQIFIGDLFNAIDELAMDSPASVNAVLYMLSLESARDLARAVGEPSPESRKPLPGSAPIHDEPIARPSAAASATEASPGQVERGAGVRAALQRVESAANRAVRPVWLDQVRELSRSQNSYAARLDPLIDPRQSRAVLAGLAAGVTDDGDLDIARILDLLVRRQPVRDLPRAREWSLRRGVQVLVDEGPGMAPFAGDAVQLVDRLQDFVLADHFELLRFSNCPLRGCRVARVRGSHDWRPASRGTPVLLVTDLGLGDPGCGRPGASVDEWLKFAEIARAAGVHVRTLAPYPLKSYVPALVRALRVVFWDRRTTAAIVRRALAVETP